MGQEVACELRQGGRVSVGTALLETDEIVFRGKEHRVRIPLRGITVVAADGELQLRWADQRASLTLGKHAARWAEKIANPKGRIDKLGVVAGMRVSLVSIDDIDDAAFEKELRARTDDVTRGARPPKQCDVIFFGAMNSKDLARLATLAKQIKSHGAIWVIRTKGPAATVTELQVMAAGKAAGLVDVKVVRFSETHTAEKFVIPVARR